MAHVAMGGGEEVHPIACVPCSLVTAVPAVHVELGAVHVDPWPRGSRKAGFLDRL